MQGGDISNRLPPRWIVVFEGVIGTLPNAHTVKEFEFSCKIRAWKHAVTVFEPRGHSVKVLWDMTWRKDYKFDVVTFLPEKCAKHVTSWIDQRNIPAANVWHYPDAARLGQELAFMPDVYAVIHANPSNRFTFGDRGMLITGEWNI